METPGGVTYLNQGTGEELLPEGDRLAQGHSGSKWKSQEGA